MMTIIRVFATLAMLASDAAEADVYSWTDKDGVVHFTNVKPRGSGSGQWKKVVSGEPMRGSKASAQRGSSTRKRLALPKDRTSASRA